MSALYPDKPGTLGKYFSKEGFFAIKMKKAIISASRKKVSENLQDKKKKIGGRKRNEWNRIIKKI